MKVERGEYFRCWIYVIYAVISCEELAVVYVA